jgi:hypothetical protein
VLIPPALFATFDWRYQLPQLTLIPIAAAGFTMRRTAEAFPDRGQVLSGRVGGDG